MHHNILRALALTLLVSIASCAPTNKKPHPKETLTLAPTSYSSLPSWNDDDLNNFAAAFSQSCAVFAKKPSTQPLGKITQAGTYDDWQSICNDITKTNNIRRFIEDRFQPYTVSDGQTAQGLFTGYYEASLKGSRTPSPVYNIPLYKRPRDLVMVQLGDFRNDLKGRRIAGRVMDGRLKPYETRAQIVNDLKSADVLVWVSDPIDAFFVQIQGSGVIELDDGTTMRIGYDGQNGHPYYAIGRELVKRGYMNKDDVSMQSIRTWLSKNPDQAKEIMNTNPSYVFFKETGRTGAIGGQGVPLTPLRSLAIDHTKIPYGVPLFVSLGAPKINRLMVAQDTGGAIRGAVRGDVFWGYGNQAESQAGQMNTQGRYWVLLPRN